MIQRFTLIICNKTTNDRQCHFVYSYSNTQYPVQNNASCQWTGYLLGARKNINVGKRLENEVRACAH